jgi:hypothetical protein
MPFRSSLVLGVLLISLLLITKDVAAARDQFTETTNGMHISHGPIFVQIYDIKSGYYLYICVVKLVIQGCLMCRLSSMIRSGGMDTMTEGAMVEDTVEGVVVDMVMGTDMVVAAEDMAVTVDTVAEDMVVEAAWELDTTEVGID